MLEDTVASVAGSGVSENVNIFEQLHSPSSSGATNYPLINSVDTAIESVMEDKEKSDRICGIIDMVLGGVRPYAGAQRELVYRTRQLDELMVGLVDWKMVIWMMMVMWMMMM